MKSKESTPCHLYFKQIHTIKFWKDLIFLVTIFILLVEIDLICNIKIPPNSAYERLRICTLPFIF